MFQGFYNLTSGMINQRKNQNVISNNIANSLTPGYKKDRMVSSTFENQMISRTGNMDRSSKQNLAESSMFMSATENITNFEQGAFEQTGLNLDFALTDDGFFQIQTEDGIIYTRNGSFIIDDEGYIALPDKGRVLGQNGPIYTGTDMILLDRDGNIIREDTKEIIGRFSIVDFEDKTQLMKEEGSIFTTDALGIPVEIPILHKTLERANVDALSEITIMMESQRALQSAAQFLKSYDQLMAKATTEIARV